MSGRVTAKTFIVEFSPTTYAAQIAQSLGGSIAVTTVAFVADWIVLVAVTLVFLWIGLKKSRWRDV